MFKIRPFEARTLIWWLGEKDNIDFHPAYQRKGALWDRKKKSYLIDSILNEFDLPKFYLADFTYADTNLNTAQKPYAVIDGRQRLEAIFDFLEGRLKIGDDFVLSKDPTLDLKGMTYSQLRSQHPRVANVFDNFNPTVMSVITDEASKINDLFVRLNTSISLSGPEIRNALPGPLPEIARRIAGHEFFTENVCFEHSRGQDLDAAYKLLLIEHRGDLVDTKRVHLDSLVNDFAKAESSDSEIHRTADRVVGILNSMAQIFRKRDPLLKTQGQLTVYYWMVRNTPGNHHPLLRQFLYDFNEFRLQHRGKNKNPFLPSIQPISKDLAHFDILSRSINDSGSQRARYHILTNSFTAMLRDNAKITPIAKQPV